MTEFKYLLPAKLFEVINKYNISTPKQILCTSIWDIKKITNLRKDEIQLLKNTAAEFIFSNEIFRGDYLIQSVIPKVPTGCLQLDVFLKGGFHCGTITELYGESGSGKTQICIHASVHNWKSGAVYICTEDEFPIKRFNQIKISLPEYDENTDYGGKIFVEHVTEYSELISCINIRLPKLMDTYSPSLIIIDSIAALFRSEMTNYIQRAQDIREIAIALINIGKKYNAAIICVNQVTACFESLSDEVLPCLGLAWSNMISTRINVRKTNELIERSTYKDASYNLFLRELTIIFAPDLPKTKFNYIITSSGISHCE